MVRTDRERDGGTMLRTDGETEGRCLPLVRAGRQCLPLVRAGRQCLSLVRAGRQCLALVRAGRHICNEELGKDRVRDHCHVTGKFRGAAHEICNLKYRVPKFFPVVFHNLSGYDSHLFIKTLGNSE